MAVCRCCLPPTGWPVPPYSMLRLHSVGILFNVALSCLALLHCVLCPEWALFVAAAYVWASYVESEHPKPILDIFTMQSSKFRRLSVCLFVCEYQAAIALRDSDCKKRRFCLPAGSSHLPSALTTLHLDRDLHLDWAQMVRVVLLSTKRTRTQQSNMRLRRSQFEKVSLDCLTLCPETQGPPGEK